MPGSWSTRRKVLVGVAIAAAVFAIPNVLYFGFMETMDGREIDLNTLRWQRVRAWELWGYTLFRTTAGEDLTPAGRALAEAGITTGLPRLSPAVGTYRWRRGFFVGEDVSLDTGLARAVRVAHDRRVVALIRRKGVGSLPTLQTLLGPASIYSIARDIYPSPPSGDPILDLLRRDFPDEDWSDPNAAGPRP